MSLRHPVAHPYTRTRKQTDASYGTVASLDAVAGTSVFVCICVCMRVRLFVCVWVCAQKVQNLRLAPAP